MHYSRVVIIFFSTALDKSAFSTYPSGKTRFKTFCVLIFHISISLVFTVLCFEFNVILMDLKAHSQILRRRTFGNLKSLKNDEKYFLFHWKSSFRSQDIYLFILTFWSCIKMAWLKKKIRSISSFMTWQPGLKTIATHLLSNIFGIKGNQTMKFGQLIEHNTGNIFVEKSYSKCAGETTPGPFSEKLNLTISLDQWSKVLCNLFLLYAKLRAIKIYWN